MSVTPSPALFTVTRAHVREVVIVAVLLFAVSALVRQAFAMGFEEGLQARGLQEWLHSGRAS